MQNDFHPKSNVDRLCLPIREEGKGLIGVQDTVEPAILKLRNHVRDSKESFSIATRAIEEDEDRTTPNEYKKRKKWMKGKHSGHNNNYIDILSGKQWVKQVKIKGKAKKSVLQMNNWSLNNSNTWTGYKNQ